MRKHPCLAVLLLAVFLAAGGIFLPRAEAAFGLSDPLDGDPNYPLTYSHANSFEYLDLSSCTVRQEGGDYYYAVGYVSILADVEGNHSSYKTRCYRLVNDGKMLQCSQDGTNWTPIPYYTSAGVRKYIREHGYMEYIRRYHAFAYFMFKRAFRQIYQREYPDGMNGEVM